MIRFVYALIIIVMLSVIVGCDKDAQSGSTPLTGTWVKGTNAGDTLYFVRSNDKNIMRYSASFNPMLVIPVETEYKLVNGKLSLRNFMAAANDFEDIESFKWIQEGKEFELLGFEIFKFMSSTQTKFTYKKVH